jgi:hypothetical protein
MYLKVSTVNIRDIYVMLGPPARQAMHNSRSPITHDSAWDCGCIIQYIDDRAVKRWKRCHRHRSRSKRKDDTVARLIARFATAGVSQLIALRVWFSGKGGTPAPGALSGPAADRANRGLEA